MIPKEILHFVALAKAAAQGDVDARLRAQELGEALEVLSSWDEGCDLVLYYKHMMVLQGDPEYALQHQPDRCPDTQPARLGRDAARAVQGLVCRMEQAARRRADVQGLTPARRHVCPRQPTRIAVPSFLKEWIRPVGHERPNGSPGRSATWPCRRTINGPMPSIWA